MKITSFRKNYIIKENKKLMNELDNLIDVLDKIAYSLNCLEQNTKNYQYFYLHSEIEYLGNKCLFLDITKNNFRLLNNLIEQAKTIIKFYVIFLDKRTKFNKNLIEQINNIDF